MNKNPKVVSLERSAAYLHHRAMMNRRDNRIVDAVELLRRAVEASPDNPEYQLDLAELYCEIGCHSQSARLLLDMLSRKDAPEECWYGLALNQLGMNDIHGARQSLDLYRRRAPEGAHLEDVDQLSMELDLYARENRPASRRLYRAMCVANRGCEALKADMPAKACRLFEASLRMAGGQHEMRALYAMALMLCGERDAALREADAAAAGFPPSVRAMCVSAQVFNLLGDRPRASKLMQSAAQEHPMGPELRMMLYSAGEMGMFDLAAEMARLGLQETPFDRELLHLRAVALMRDGAPEEEAARCWERILRLDPEDTVARYYADAAVRGALEADALPFAYQVPEGEYVRRMKLLANALSEGFDALRDRWREDADFRGAVRWAVYTDEARLGRAAVTVLATLEDPEAASLLRELMMEPEVSRENKLHALVVTRLEGRPLSEILPADAQAGNALVDIDRLLADLPVGERQLVRFADEVLSREYNLHALPALALMWSSYRKLRGMRGDPLKRMEASAGALAYNFLLANGQTPDVGALARHFGSDVRQLVFCARRIAGTLERNRH